MILQEISFVVRNTRTGELYEVVTDMEELEETLIEGANRCCGPCECWIEPDGICPNGWPALERASLDCL
jgi:hypothetical protein